MGEILKIYFNFFLSYIKEKIQKIYQLTELLSKLTSFIFDIILTKTLKT